MLSEGTLVACVAGRIVPPAGLQGETTVASCLPACPWQAGSPRGWLRAQGSTSGACGGGGGCHTVSQSLRFTINGGQRHTGCFSEYSQVKAWGSCAQSTDTDGCGSRYPDTQDIHRAADPGPWVPACRMERHPACRKQRPQLLSLLRSPCSPAGPLPWPLAASKGP